MSYATGAPVFVDVPTNEKRWPGARPPSGTRAWIVQAPDEVGSCTVLLENDDVVEMSIDFLAPREPARIEVD